MKSFGYSVTHRIKTIKQPRGGYLNLNLFSIISLSENCNMALNSNENVNASLIGSAVDYLTRFLSGTSLDKAFEISFFGACLLKKQDIYKSLVSQIKSNDSSSVVAAIKLTGFDSAYRAGLSCYKPIELINPNSETIENVQIMVKRSLIFLEIYGPKIKDGLTFEGGYTKVVSAGDCDFLTRDTLRDFKVSKNKPKSEHTLQLLVYWRLGLHSIHKSLFERVKYLGIFNPRLNCVYRIKVDDIPLDIIESVEKDVICY